MNKKTDWPVVALIYDFDGTLSPANMQEYDFLKEVGISDKKKFWNESNQLAKDNEASGVLCYMKLMIEKSKMAKKSIRREAFVNFGKSIELYEGVKEWFGLVNQMGDENGVRIEHYINSSGLREMIEGTDIYKEFKEVYACSFLYDVDGIATWPAVAVDFTAKTQFLFMINKGISKVSENYRINEYMAECDRPVPFKHMIYFGDGETDIPCMRLVKEQGGNSIAVYNKDDKAKKNAAKRLIKDNRVTFACEANYKKGGEMWRIVEAIIRQVKSNYDFQSLKEANLNVKKLD
jgi:phosphoserine phosphatase